MKGGEYDVPRNNQLYWLLSWPRFFLPARIYTLRAMSPEQRRRDLQTEALSGEPKEKRECR